VIRAHRYDWFDKVQMWRAHAPKQRITRQLGVGDSVQYLFGIRRFVHNITAETTCQMEVVKPSEYSAT
jgi:hypothetical protein